ncbi:MAG: hypothetical protein JWN15_2176 [Firmicutes bacterium]|nr:hypothetical protein [Bacillota bacterium]
MATAIYDRTIDAGQEPDRQAVSIVKVDGVDVQVAWWPSLLTQTNPLFQMSKTAIRTYLEAEALCTQGFTADARTHLAGMAAGTDTRTYDANHVQTGGTDARNWAKRWVDEHADPGPVTPAVDPLLGP